MQATDRRPQTADRPVLHIPPRTAAEAATRLPADEQADIVLLDMDLAELRRENPLAKMPASAAQVYLMERSGWVWDFEDGVYRIDETKGGPVSYRLTAEGLRLAGG